MKKNNRTGQKEGFFTVTFLPFGVQIQSEAKATILDAALKAGATIFATCGGKGTCGDCAVQVISGDVKEKKAFSLPKQLAAQGYVLACQTEISNDVVVKLPRYDEVSIKSVTGSEYFEDQKDNLSGVFEVAPPIKKIALGLPAPTLEDNYSDLKRIERELLKKHGISDTECEFSVLQKLAESLRKDNGNVSVVLLSLDGKWNIIDVFPQSQPSGIFGICCDIGTSTVVLQLIDLKNGKVLSTASSYNLQIQCGEDIISRIIYSQKPGRLDELQALIVKTINRLIEKVSQACQIDPSQIYLSSLSGNTTMIHLLLKLDPRYIREEPYVPTVNRIPLVLARDLGLLTHTEARTYCAPAIGSYVGGDITSGLLNTPVLNEKEKISMFIDAGTNGELVVGNQEWLMTCACSTGPAFEGSGTSCGMSAVTGAIENIKLNESGEPAYNVIGNTKPKGVCGSGLVDILAELFVHGFIDRHGKFLEKQARDRLVDTDYGKGFLIEFAENSYWGKDIVITEKDISNLIRAKGAVYSACSLLLKNVGLEFKMIDSFYIAGGFGQSLNVENSIRIGLLPDLERRRFKYIGNSSLLGAYLLLLSEKNRKIVDTITSKMTYVELNTESSYMHEFTGSLFLPHTELKLFPTVERELLSRIKFNKPGGKHG